MANGGRMRGPRTGLVGRLRRADALLSSKMALLLGALDAQTVHEAPLWGGTLSRAEFRTLLASDQGFQSSLVAKLPFLTAGERAALARELTRVLPAASAVTDTVQTVPPLPFPPPLPPPLPPPPPPEGAPSGTT